MTSSTTAAAGRVIPVRRGGVRSRRLGNDWIWAYMLIAPTAIGLAVFTVWPAVQTFAFSFTEWGAFGGHEWIGLENYADVLQDPRFGQSLLNTFILTGISLLAVPISIVLAALLNRHRLRGVTVYRTIYYLPVVTLPAAVALTWGMLYNGDFGVINQGLALLGIDGPSWIADPATAIYAIGIVAIWGSIGYNMVLFVAGMQSIPRAFYEAAELDGAGRARQFFSITMPLLTPTTFFVTVITVINSLQVFDLVYLMVGRTSPALDKARTVVYLFYERGFIQGDGGYAAAIAFVLLAIIVVLTAIQFRVQRRWVHYG